MASGTITCYQDTQRTILKNWYYQIGTPGNYTYIALPNPLTLSASGTICDINGNDVLPFFYPYNELDSSTQQSYYITIVSYDMLTQITRSNFPFLAGSAGGGNTASASQENYIINNVFWRNQGTQNLSSVTATTPVTVAPSQHDGFRYPDIQFFKSTAGATDTLTFPSLTGSTTFTGDPTPQYYLNHACTVANAETYKYYQFPLSYQIATLSGQECTVTFQGQSDNSGTSLNNTVSLYVFQDLGTNTNQAPIFVQSFLLTQTWTKNSWTFTLPSSALSSLSAAGDNALYLQLWLPVGVTFNISFTKLSLYLGTIAPTNNFSTYDQIDPIINGARTGDIRTSLNSFSPMGWVPANDGTIGSATSSATTRANIDTWPLYNLIWNSVSNTYAPVTTGRGSSAYADFTANKSMALTKTLSRLLGTAGSGAGLSTWALGENSGAESITLTVGQLPPHAHGIGTGNSGPGFQSFQLAGSSTSAPGGPTSSIGSNDPVNILPPAVYYNVFFKL
jgi:hypothetical protein